VIATYVIQYSLVRLIPSIILPLPTLTLLLRTVSKVSFFYFYIWIQNTSTRFTLSPPFLVPSLHPLIPTPGKELIFFLPAFHFLKVCINSPREFHLAHSGLYILCFNQIDTLPNHLLILHHHDPLVFNNLQYR
jgi:hypothetical protein